MCAEQLDREKSLWQAGVFFFLLCFVFFFFSRPACCFEGYDRWRQALSTPQCRSREGARNYCWTRVPIYRQFGHSLCSPAWGKSSSLTETNKYTHVLTGTCKYSDTAPCNSPRRTMDEAHIKKWQPPPLTSLRPAEPHTMQFAPHALAPFFANNYLLYSGRPARACV